MSYIVLQRTKYKFDKYDNTRDRDHSVGPLFEFYRCALVEFAGIDGYNVYNYFRYLYLKIIVSKSQDFVLQESNFTYDSKNPSEVNHDVFYKEGENKRVSIIVKKNEDFEYIC